MYLKDTNTMKLILILYVELRKPKPFFFILLQLLKSAFTSIFRCAWQNSQTSELMLFSLWNVSSLAVKQLHKNIRIGYLAMSEQAYIDHKLLVLY